MKLSEPMGSKGPGFTSDDKMNSFSRPANISLNILCPAQGYPVPSFRSDFLSSSVCKLYMYFIYIIFIK